MSTLEIIVLVEYALVFLISFSLCILKIIFFFQERKKQREIGHLKELLKGLIVGKNTLDHVEKQIKTDPDLLLCALETFELLVNDEKWKTIKSSLVEKYLLPWARKASNSFFLV